MASSSKKRSVPRRQPVVVDVGCGCRRSKLSSLISSYSTMPKQKNPKSSSSASASTTTRTASYASSPSETSKRSTTRKKKKKMGAVEEDSEAVVKESSDPYFDFRDSMLHMIVEKEMYAWEDLRDLLHRFLSLNSPYHHHLILRAFAEIVNGFFSADSGGAGEAAGRRDGGW